MARVAAGFEALLPGLPPDACAALGGGDAGRAHAGRGKPLRNVLRVVQ